MTLTRLLLASTAISLSGLGYSHAAPLSQSRVLDAPAPAVIQYLARVQMSVEDAELELAAAKQRLADAEASGGDVEAAKADVASAEAQLEAAQAAAQGNVAPEPAAPAEPEPAPEATAAPEAAEEVPEEVIPPAEPAPEAPAEPETEPQPAAEAEAPAEPETAPEPAAEPEAAAEPETATEPAAEPTAEPAPVQPEAAPAAEAPVETPESDETVPVPEPAPEPEPTPETAPEAAAEPEASAAPEEVKPTEPAAEEGEAKPADAEPAAEPAPEASPEAQPEPGAAATGTPEEEVLVLPVEDGAPVLDSAKEEPAEGEADTAPAAAPESAEPAAPPPASDEEAQAPARSAEPAPPQAMAEEGERMDAAPEPEAETNVTIINQIDNRTIIQVDNRTIIEHDERDRLRAGSEEVYYERLTGGRTREIIVRPNGVQLITITNRWGDVIQRSRVMPDGREYVLFYASASSDGSRQAFVDPGRRLPPLRLQIPIDEYILDATVAQPSAYLDFLMEPPVEQVERLYTVEEVRRSARIRDKVRRIDLDILTFEFGKATIAEDQIQRLSDVAEAMQRILEKNPAETFLIEGHTDAVGRDEANLLLSDKRAETIAVALSDVFGIPPENLVTQGYGERYLKVRTEAPERLNRRVTIRRITPLVTPVASR